MSAKGTASGGYDDRQEGSPQRGQHAPGAQDLEGKQREKWLAQLHRQLSSKPPWRVAAALLKVLHGGLKHCLACGSLVEPNGSDL